MIQTINQILEKAKDPYRVILEYMNKPLEELGSSLAQLFLAKQVRTK